MATTATGVPPHKAIQHHTRARGCSAVLQTEPAATHTMMVSSDRPSSGTPQILKGHSSLCTADECRACLQTQLHNSSSSSSSNAHMEITCLCFVDSPAIHRQVSWWYQQLSGGGGGGVGGSCLLLLTFFLLRLRVPFFFFGSHPSLLLAMHPCSCPSPLPSSPSLPFSLLSFAVQRAPVMSATPARLDSDNPDGAAHPCRRSCRR